MRRLLATDLDGTLVMEREITPENVEAVKELKAKGNIFTVSTGRPLNGISHLEKDYNIKADYYVLLNGALILDKNREIVEHKKISRNTVLEIVGKYKSTTKMSVETGFMTYLLTKVDHLPYPNNLFVESMDEVNEDISLIAIYMPESDISEIEKIKDYINENYDDVVAYRNAIFIDVVPKGCSKGEGVKFISRLADIELNNVYTIGDSWNDVSMFKVTKNSFTFNHAEEALKKEVTNLVGTVSACINDFVLK